MIILGIETSCDETALALIETRESNGVFECRVISSLINSQAELHRPYGGVFPNLAKREHEKNLIPLLEKTLEISGECPAEETLAKKPSSEKITDKETYEKQIELFRDEYGGQNRELVESIATASFLTKKPNIDIIAVTEGPGLEPALWTGIIFGKMLGTLWNVPIIPINHMEGHVVGSLLQSETKNGDWQRLKPLDMPALAFLISGGHTELVKVESNGVDIVTNVEQSPTTQSTSYSLPKLTYTIIGQTKDDAVGEAFDKVARLLGLPYPGGPEISKLAQKAREENISSVIKLPRPMINSKDLNFSFSGLKTAVLYAIRDREKTSESNDESRDELSDNFKKGLAREFEDAVIETLDTKLRKAVDETGAKTIIVGGGVSANKLLRERLEKTTAEYGISLYLPSNHVSGDNALMIALAGAFNTEPIIRPLRAHGTKRLGAR